MYMKAVFAALAAVFVMVMTGCGNSSARQGATGAGAGMDVAVADSALYASAYDESVLEVSFHFTRQGGIASNQFAVWIEDIQGRYVRTLYATRWTATGGWQRRETSVPQWVNRSGLAGRGHAHIDALAGPTPQTGVLSYLWDGRNYAGQPVPPGEYQIFVEGSLRWENRVLYTAVVRLGEAGQVSAVPMFFGDSTQERGMIGPVTVAVTARP